MEDSPQKLYLPDGDFIAYHKHDGKENHTGVIFLCGFMSDMEGIKATALEKLCRSKGYPYIRFDYSGHGKSSRNFTDCTISIWKQNVLDVLDKLTTGKQILIGSSMGGWLMLLAALERPDKIAGLIGIASAPDFTEDLIWEKMSPAEQLALQKEGIFNLKSDFSDNPYPVTKQLLDDGRKHLFLRENANSRSPLSRLPHFPVRLIHGLMDADVPASVSQRLVKLFSTKDVKLNLIEDGDHRMSTPENISLLCDTLDELMLLH